MTDDIIIGISVGFSILAVIIFIALFVRPWYINKRVYYKSLKTKEEEDERKFLDAMNFNSDTNKAILESLKDKKTDIDMSSIQDPILKKIWEDKNITYDYIHKNISILNPLDKSTNLSLESRAVIYKANIIIRIKLYIYNLQNQPQFINVDTIKEFINFCTKENLENLNINYDIYKDDIEKIKEYIQLRQSFEEGAAI